MSILSYFVANLALNPVCKNSWCVYMALLSMFGYSESEVISKTCIFLLCVCKSGDKLCLQSHSMYVGCVWVRMCCVYCRENTLYACVCVCVCVCV